MTPGEAIVGVRGSDALAFADWASTVTGGASTYRLPAAASLDYSMHRGNPANAETATHTLCAWVNDGGQRTPAKPSLWIPGGMRDPRALDPAFLTDAVKSDVSAATPPAAMSFFGPRLILMRKVIKKIDLAGRDARSADVALAQVHSYAYEENLADASELVAALISDLNTAASAPDQAAEDLSADIGLALCLALARRIERAAESTEDFRSNPPPGVDYAYIRKLRNLLRQAHTFAWRLVPKFTRDGLPSGPRAGSSDLVPDSLVDSVVTASRNAADINDMTNRLALALADDAKINSLGRQVNIDADGMSANLANVVTSIADEIHAYSSDRNFISRSWIQETAAGLLGDAGRVFSRKVPPAAEISASIRLSALILAGAMHYLQKHPLSRPGSREENESFSQAGIVLCGVAAGVTWLERRYVGADPATETIMLALE